MAALNKAAHSRGVLFIQETPGRNGAAMLLLHLLRWFKANGGRPFSLALTRDGEISAEFADVTKTWIAGNSKWCPGGLRAQVLKALGLGSIAKRMERAGLRRIVRPFPPALIYLNAFSAHNWGIIKLLDTNTPLLTHLHEFGFLLLAQGRADTPRILARTSHFIACSGAVKESLVRQRGIPAERVDVVHESIDVAGVRAERSRADVLRELGFPDETFLVAGCGRTGWNKGVDLFLRLAHLVCRQRNRARFVWLGESTSWQIEELEHDAGTLGLGDKIRFTGSVPKAVDYFGAADVYALTSREDSFPLTCLESAALGKPIVCFADAGGMPEFVEEDCGFVVPYIDVEAMAERVVSLLDCPACREKMGAAARRKVSERHDIRVTALRIVEIIERTIAEAR